MDKIKPTVNGWMREERVKHGGAKGMFTWPPLQSTGSRVLSDGTGDVRFKNARSTEFFDMATAINNEVVPSIWVTSRCEGVLNLTLQELLVGTLTCVGNGGEHT